jgi:hypothetical protein
MLFLLLWTTIVGENNFENVLRDREARFESCYLGHHRKYHSEKWRFPKCSPYKETGSKLNPSKN